MSVKTILKIIACIILGMLALSLMMHVLGWLALLAYTGAIGLVFAAIGYGIFLLVKPKTKKTQQLPMQHKVWDMHGKPIYVFRNEPVLLDVVKVHDELHMTKLELQGDVFQLPNDSDVIVLEDTGKESVKIRVKGAKKKAVDVEGWIGRSSLVQENKQISGPK